ncbi:uncharacterized protein LOC121784455 [Salvia splendens]|uniref:uncharacterized protein LOC121784455 n=1 Tax=Salvia splendens TaxID=180675 RepID=UPI001C279068|nr:uncharacterized protein LOC121784455 [Salvia splendens]
MQPAGNRDYTYTEFVSRLENNYQFRDVHQIPAMMFGGFCRRLCLKAMRVFKEEEEDFVNCVLQVDLDDGRWEKSLRKLRLSCRAVRQWNVYQNGRVEISAFAKPNNLMRRIRRSEPIELVSMQAGQCSSNLYLKEAPKPVTSNPPQCPSPYPYGGGYGYPQPPPLRRVYGYPQPPPLHRVYGYPQPPPLHQGYGQPPAHPLSEPYDYGYGYRPLQSRFVFGQGQLSRY